MRRLSHLILPATLLLATGCGIAPTVTTPTGFTGAVHGGQQPISGATIQLYAVGTTGDGSAATPLGSSVTTDANGNFTLINPWNCPTGNTAALVYLLATGGNPGFSDGPYGINSHIAEMVLLGPCNALTQSTFVNMNEITTVAAVYPLAQFMTSTSIGSSSLDAAALQSAFTLSSELANPSTGRSPGLNVPNGTTIPVTEIYTLADIIATCINSTGGTAGDGSLCGQLFTLTTAPSATAPTNTITALLAIAQHPTLNTPSLFNLFTAIPPYQPVLTTAPPDFNVLALVTPATPSLQLSTASINFASATVGVLAGPQTVTIQNTGPSTVTLGAITLTGANSSDYSISNGCGSTLGAGASCAVQVYVTPTVSGTRTAYLSIVSSTSASPEYVSLSATVPASVAVPTATVSATELDFSFSGSSRDVTLTNAGGSYLSFNGTSTLTPFFTVTNTCGAGLAAGASCVLTVLEQAPYEDVSSFVSQYGDDLLSISLGSAAPLTVTLVAGGATGHSSWVSTSNVVLPIPSVSSTTVSVNYLFTPQSCPTLAVTSGFSVFGGALIGNAGNGYYVCNYTVMATASATGRLTLSDGSYIPLIAANGTSSSSVTLTGTGTYTLSNYGTSNINIQSVTATAGFTQTNNCGTILYAQSLCTINTAIVPSTLTGGIQGSLTIVDDAGTQATQLTSYVPEVLDMLSVAVGTSDPFVYSYGASRQNYATVTTTSPFVGGACGSYYNYCTIPIGFMPTSIGTFSAPLSISSYGTNGNQSAQYLLTGTGVASGPSLGVPRQGTQSAIVGTYGVAVLPTIYNTGTTPLTLSPPVFTGPNAANFSPLYPGQACSMLPLANCSSGAEYLFKPTQTGFVYATMTFTDTTSGKTFSTLVSGYGTPPAPTFSPSQVSFPNTHLNTTSVPESVVIYSYSQHPIVATTSSSVFTFTKSTCVQGEVPCILTLLFTPTSAITYGTYLTVTDTVTGLTASVPTEGIGGRGVGSGSAPISFAGTRAVGSTSLPLTATLTNVGDAPIYQIATSLTGANASEFSISSTNCPGTNQLTGLAPGASCTVMVSFAPTTAGSKTASLLFSMYTDESGSVLDSFVSIALTGTAQ